MAKVTSRSRCTAPAKFPPGGVPPQVIKKPQLAKITDWSRNNLLAKLGPASRWLRGTLQSVFVDVMKEVFPALDLELGVFLVAEALTVVDGDL